MDLSSQMVEIVKTMNFACVKHKMQKRKDPEGTPYINHPIGEAWKSCGTCIKVSTLVFILMVVMRSKCCIRNST